MTYKNDESATSKLVGISILFAGIPLDAWVLKTMWWWFAVPLGVVGVGMAHALADGAPMSNGPDITEADRYLAEASVFAEIAEKARGMTRGAAHPAMRDSFVEAAASALASIMEIDARAKAGGV